MELHTILFHPASMNYLRVLACVHAVVAGARPIHMNAVTESLRTTGISKDTGMDVYGPVAKELN